MCFFAILQVFPGISAGAGEVASAVPTFECIGLYWKAPGGAADTVCEARYRADRRTEWKQALPLWFDPRNQEYRGSIVNLQPGTRYEVGLQLRGTTTSVSLQARTWSEAFSIAKKNALPGRSNKTLTISESGSQDGYVVYETADPSGSVIDVASESDYCIVVQASYVILRGLTLKGARVHAILLREAVHDVVIEECDISGWGRIAEDGWGRDYDAAIYSRDPGVKRVIVQRNRIHHPRSNSNNWQQERPGPGKTEPSHPEGPQAVCLWDSEGNHVFRYNTVFSDDNHQYNDVFGAGHNFSTRGFPNRDSDIYGNLLSHCWDDAIESEGANCNVRIWGNYITEAFVGVACASTSIGPLYVWRNVTGVIRESPTKIAGAFLKTSNKMGGGRIYVFHNTILQPDNPSDPNKTLGAVVGLGWGGPMTNVTSRNNILDVTRQVIADRARDPLGDYDYDLFSLPVTAGENQEKHGLRGKPVYVPGYGLKDGRGTFALAATSPGFDAGVVIPNFNDGFSGSAPDLGAQEAGSRPMEFGVEAYRNHAAQKPRTALNPSDRVVAFYYPWYGNPATDGRYANWNHPVAVRNEPPRSYAGGDDIGSNFYPSLGCYSVNDPEVLSEHMRQLRQAGVGVICASWWGRDTFTDRALPGLFQAAEKAGLLINFHIEPFPGRNAVTTRQAIAYLVGRFGASPACHCLRSHGNKPVFFVYDSYRTPAGEWATVLQRQGTNSIRGTDVDAVVIGLWVKQNEEQFMLEGGFDGFYTYFATDGFTFGSTFSHWTNLAKWARDHQKIFIPCVAPGYIDTRIRPWNGVNTRDREAGAYYDRSWSAALAASPELFGITSFNEWHEGTQIERAAPKQSLGFTYLNYLPLPADYYLDRTAHWIRKMNSK